jgi:hypothetical protein
MIKVTRKSVRAPDVLSGTKAEEELRKARAFYRPKANRAKEFSFTVYQDRSVRDKLEELFRMKCAYCETKIGAGDESEIEHWRPKGAVKEDDGRRLPGYYWLATTWDNLLLSCLKCNRPRKYRLGAGEENEEVWERSGKGMLFPLAEGDRRATKRGGESSEHPLLLDPCKDRPDQYLEFVLFDDENVTNEEERRRKALVRPKATRGRRFDRGVRSIDVYSLNRPILLDRRRAALTDVQRHLATFKDAMETFNALQAGQAALRERQSQIMRTSAEAIRDRLKPDAEYLLMTKQALKDFIDNNPAVRRPLKAALGG